MWEVRDENGVMIAKLEDLTVSNFTCHPLFKYNAQWVTDKNNKLYLIMTIEDDYCLTEIWGCLYLWKGTYLIKK